ncbi:MAG: DUF302 domain-containing protein [Bacteriovorax sp.]|nr:DUF302 domain-containing protein [Bacteriovorax sp.]
MLSINFKKEVKGQIDEVTKRLIEKLGQQGFGVLTRIDFHEKIKEKLGKDLPPVIILGACNPALAYEAFQRNTDVTSLIPCNAVVRMIDKEKVSVELTKPSSLMAILGDKELQQLATEADFKLEKVLEEL